MEETGTFGFSVRAAARTHAGRVRRENQDAFGCDVAAGLFCVADGLGGHAGGEAASRIVRDMVMDSARAEAAGDAALARQLFRAAAEHAHHELLAHGASHPRERDLGSTLTALRLQGPRAEILHVGDSRAYRCRSSLLQPLTEDHSLVFDLLRRGIIATREEARAHPRSNIVTQCVGGGSEAPVPDFVEVDVAAGDRFLLVTDGLTDLVPEAGIAALCGEHEDPERLADALVEAALAAGGRDNITVVVVDIGGA